MKGTAMETGRREFLGSLGVGMLGARLVGAQTPAAAPSKLPVRKAKTTVLFKSPEGYRNALAVAPEGLWIGEQKTDNACLVDWGGKPVKVVRAASEATSRMAGRGGVILDG